MITITNYEQYAQKIDDLPAQFPAHNGEHITAHDEASSGAACEGHAAHLPAHKTAQFPAHHEQQYNNNNINIKISSSRNSEESRNEATQKFLSRHPEAADGIYTPAGKSWGTADDLKAARWIHSLRLTVNASLSEPKWVEWANTIRLMRVQDKRTHFEICDLFKWANKDDFWKDNILSPSSLRRKWDDLTTKRLRSGGQTAKTTAKGKVDFNNTDWINGVFDEKSF